MKTNQRSVSRLSRYRNVLSRFKSYGLAWVYSDQIASALGITAAQVRKDFSQFGLTGKRKIGYHVDLITEHLNRILGKNDQNTAIIAGFGMLGRAFYNDYFSHERGIRIVAAFDENVSAATPHESEGGLPVHPLTSLISYATGNRIRFGVITIADKTAQNVLDLMILSGIQGVLSLSPFELKSPKTCFVNTVNVLREFENVVFFTGNNGHKKTRRQ